jgi:hypothetical protein
MRRIFADESKLGGCVLILAAGLALCSYLLGYRRDQLEIPLYWSVVGAMFLVQGVYRFIPERKSTKTMFYCLEGACVTAFIGVLVHFHT